MCLDRSAPFTRQIVVDDCFGDFSFARLIAAHAAVGQHEAVEVRVSSIGL